MKKFFLALASGRLVSTVVRRGLRGLSRVLPLPFSFLVESGALQRPAHAYCMWHAARLARELGYAEISVAEFGVAGGNTLRILERYAQEIEKSLGVRLQLFGFDTGSGLPPPQGELDLPYWFRSAQYAMDTAALAPRLQSAQLVLGNVRDTVGDFFAKPGRPPLAVILNDLDYFSSSRDAMKILDTSAVNFLPRLFVYLDDVVGGPEEMYGPCNGQLAAVELFNQSHDRIKLHLNQNLLPDSSLPWRTQIYYAHLFDHPRYQDYIGGSRQAEIEAGLKLQG